MKKLVLILTAAGSLLSSGASAADLPALKAMASSPLYASLVPQSAFFAGLGGSVNSLGYESQNIYAQGVSSIFLNGAQVAFGQAGGPTTPRSTPEPRSRRQRNSATSSISATASGCGAQKSPTAI